MGVNFLAERSFDRRRHRSRHSESIGTGRGGDDGSAAAAAGDGSRDRRARGDRSRERANLANPPRRSACSGDGGAPGRTATAVGHRRRSGAPSNRCSASALLTIAAAAGCLPGAVRAFSTPGPGTRGAGMMRPSGWVSSRIRFGDDGTAARFPDRGAGFVPLSMGKIVDAEVVPDDEVEGGADDEDAGEISDAEEANGRTNLIEYSQSQDPDWKKMPMAFLDADTGLYIDCTLAFYAECDGTQYALGVPIDTALVVASEDGEFLGESRPSGMGVTPLDPDDVAVDDVDDDEDDDGGGGSEGGRYESVFQMAARALVDEFGSEVRLKRTPRVLTAEGGRVLERQLGDWREILEGGKMMGLDQVFSIYDEKDDGEVAKQPTKKATAMEKDAEEADDFFDQIMKRDLGPDYMKLLDDDDGSKLDNEVSKLFDASYLQETASTEVLNELDLVADVPDDDDGSDAAKMENPVDKPSAALKILNFLGPEEKEYTILKPLRPVVLVGRDDPNDYTRRILLSPEEAKDIVPRLERLCKAELEEAGLFLRG